MDTFCDLHTHSVFSDGTCTPAELIDEAIGLGLSAIALTDHNTADGLPDFLAAAEGKDILAIPGAEFSVDWDGTELHLQGLFIAPSHFPTVLKMSEDYLRRKTQSNLDLIAALNRDGYHLEYDRIRAQSPNGNINRAHIAAALTEQGYVGSNTAAFGTLLSKNGGYYREPAKPTIWEMLDFIISIDAVPVLAHPLLDLTPEELARLLPQAKERGLRGMEVACSKYDDAATACAVRMAREFGLLPSGGSDYHGSKKPDVRMGVGRGNLRVPRRWAEALKNL